MRYRVTEYRIEGQTIVLPEQITIEDIRLIVNETQKKVICSSMQKDNVDVQSDNIIVPLDICTLKSTDQLTIEIDKGDSLADIQLPEVDTANLAKEQTLTDGVNTLSDKIDNLSTTMENNYVQQIAKQGDDPNATLTAIYKLLKGSEPDTPEVIPEGVAERLALILEFFGMKPIQAYEFMTEEEVCSDLEEIMMSMDINLTPEKAKEITNSTLNKE